MIINYIYLDITNKCNMDCLYCCKKNDLKPIHDLNISLLNKILIWGKLHNANAITLSGGEPVLHDNFELILKEIKNNNYDKLRIMTNGYLFKYNLNASQMDLIDEVCFSIDTDIEEANKATRIGFDNSIIQEIDYFHKQFPAINLTIKATITVKNIDHIKSLINFSIRHGFSKITFGFCLPIGRCIDMDLYQQIRGTSPDLIKIQDYIVRMKRRYKLLIEITEPCVVFGCKLINNTTNAFDLHIDENGFIYPCDGMNDPEHIVANISDNELEKCIINNFENIKLMIIKNNEKCNSCTIHEDCEGSCLLYGKSSNEHDADMFCEFRRLKIVQNNLMRVIIND